MPCPGKQNLINVHNPCSNPITPGDKGWGSVFWSLIVFKSTEVGKSLRPYVGDSNRPTLLVWRYQETHPVLTPGWLSKITGEEVDNGQIPGSSPGDSDQ